MSTKRIPNRDIPDFVARLQPFLTANATVEGINQRVQTPTGDMVDLYITYSYGYHWPLAVYDPRTSTWYTHGDRCSNTTTRHAALVRQGIAHHVSSCPPDLINCVTLPDVEDLKDLIRRGGLSALVADRLRSPTQFTDVPY